MNNEETRLINDEPINTDVSVNSAPEKKSSKGKTVAATAGGFVGGVAVGAGVAAHASTSAVSSENIAEFTENESENSQPDEIDDNQVGDKTDTMLSVTPDPEQVIMATDTGVRYAHVDADNFADAFAQAREQVGPGGVFEYDGKIYGTFYADEWNNMSNQERADFQSRVNDVAPAHHSTIAHNVSPTHVAETHEPFIEHQEARESEVAHNAELVSEEPINNEVRVLGVEAVQNDDGSIMNVALLENGGDNALMVDVDNDGMIEIFVHDDNFDGQIQDNEVHDIADAGIHVNDLLAAQATQEGDYLAASDDGMPDYMDDADTMMEA